MSLKKQKAVKEIFEKMQQTRKLEKIRIEARKKAQRKGKSIATQKSSKSTRRPTREARRVTKKRSSIR